MPEIAVGGFKSRAIPSSIGRRTKKIGAHVVVHAVHVPASLAKKRGHFAVDEAAGTGNEEMAGHAGAIRLSSFGSSGARPEAKQLVGYLWSIADQHPTVRGVGSDHRKTRI